MPVLVNTLVEKPIASMIGLVLLGAGVPPVTGGAEISRGVCEAWLES
jgi:hypothetical protein